MCHVLIIEDDVIAVSDIQATLSSAGAISFSVAMSAEEALQAARSMKPDVITADVMLGDSSGVEAARSIQAELGQLPVIFITETPDECQGCDLAMVIEKPFDAAHLADLFRSVAPH